MPTLTLPLLYRHNRRRACIVGVAALATLALHAAVLGGLDTAGTAEAVAFVASAAPVSVSVRLVSPAAPASVQAVSFDGSAETASVEAPGSARAQPQRDRRPSTLAASRAGVGAPTDRSVVVVRATEAGTDFLPVADDSVSLDATQAPPAQAAASSTTAAPSPGTPESTPAQPPAAKVYSTRIPHAFAFRYTMQRGPIGGIGEFALKRTGDQYEARLQGSVGPLNILSWTSTGSIDSAGFAPVRYVDQRIGKSAQAANFQRSEAKVTFSGSSNQYALMAGMQDRLSWMVQLPAVLAADPSRRKAGTRIPMVVIGSHGEIDNWVFESSGPESVTTPSGTISALKWRREPSKPYDTEVEVWLDPSRQFLPVKARLTSPPSDSPLELQLVSTGT